MNELTQIPARGRTAYLRETVRTMLRAGKTVAVACGAAGADSTKAYYSEDLTDDQKALLSFIVVGDAEMPSMESELERFELIVCKHGGTRVHDSINLPGDVESLKAIRDELPNGPLRRHLKEMLFHHTYGRPATTLKDLGSMYLDIPSIPGIESILGKNYQDMARQAEQDARMYALKFTVVDRKCDDGIWRCVCKVGDNDLASVLIPVIDRKTWQSALNVARGIFDDWEKQVFRPGQNPA